MLARRAIASVLKFDGEIGDDEKAIRLGELAGLGVVIVDGGELVAQIFLDDRLHVLLEIGEPLIDLFAIGEDATADERFVVIAQDA